MNLMRLFPQLSGPQSGLLLLQPCMGIARLIFEFITYQPIHMEEAVLFSDKWLLGAIEDIVVCGGPFFGDI